MSNHFSLVDGTFAGQVIRITPDHYASVLDVIKVTGGARDPSNVWNDIKRSYNIFVGTSSDFSETVSGPLEVSNGSRSSTQSIPRVKTYKFTGQGQRK